MAARHAPGENLQRLADHALPRSFRRCQSAGGCRCGGAVQRDPVAPSRARRECSGAPPLECGQFLPALRAVAGPAACLLPREDEEVPFSRLNYGEKPAIGRYLEIAIGKAVQDWSEGRLAGG